MGMGWWGVVVVFIFGGRGSHKTAWS